MIRDFSRARVKALNDIKNRVPQSKRVGMPRMKLKAKARPSLNYTRTGFRLVGGRLQLAKGILVRAVWSRPLPADPSSVRVFQDSLGHWYASFVVTAQVQPLPETRKAVGVDWGVRVLATTTSDDYDLLHPEFGKRVAAAIAHGQRVMARRRSATPGGQTKGYGEARLHVARLFAKAARQRQDVARKWAKRLVRDFDQLAVEDLRPGFLATTNMARKAADAAIAATKYELINMARKHSRELRLVNPAHTTTDCSQCGARTKHALPLSERTFHCTYCGHSEARDKNSAAVMLTRAGFNPAGVESGRPERPLVGQAA